MHTTKVDLEGLVDRRRALAEGRLGRRILLSIQGIRVADYPDDRARLVSESHRLPPVGTLVDEPPSVENTIDVFDATSSHLLGVADDKLPILDWCHHHGHAMLCAFLGWDIRYFSVEHAISSEVVRKASTIEELLDLEFDDTRPLVSKIVSSLSKGQTYAAGRAYMVPTLCSGGLAIMTQFLGYEKGLLELHDKPKACHRFFEKVMDMEIRFVEMAYEAIGSVAGGWSLARFDWSPVPCVGLNLDDYLLCPNETFVEFGLPYFQKMIDHFGRGLIHYHTPDMRLMKDVRRLRNIALQVGSDPNLQEPWQQLASIRNKCQDIPITWLRIPRRELIAGMEEQWLPGNVEYCTHALDFDDANRLVELARAYRSP